MLGIIKSDKQIRADTYQFPEEIHLENIGSYNQTKHTHGKERKKSIETLESFLITNLVIFLITLCHIAQRINMDHETNRCNDNKHHHTDWSKAEPNVESQQFGKFKPSKIKYGNRRIQTVGTTAVNEEILISSVQRHCKKYA